MPYVLNEQTLPIGAAFQHNGIKYPPNWLQLSTEQDRDALGIEWRPEPEPYDQTFYWAPDVPKDHGELVAEYVDTTKGRAYGLLQKSDWLFIRELDNAVPVDESTRSWREDVRLACQQKIAAINATTTVAELASYVTGSEYALWPTEPVET